MPPLLALLAAAAALAQEPDPGRSAAAGDAPRPNLLLCIADDWSAPHAGVLGDPVVRTPSFDRLAREGVLFRHAYASAPSCTPSRVALLTGQWHWRLGAAANLWCVLPDRLTTYPEILARAGYAVGTEGRDWGPGRTESAERQPLGPTYRFREFLAQRPKDRPFCFWLGGFEPHRPYEYKSGRRGGIDLEKIRVPACYPDAVPIRNDLADYALEVQRFDAEVGDALRALEEHGLLESTLVVVTSDNGMPFPRAKSNVYDLGVRVPLALRWGRRVRAGRSIDDFVSLTDLAPTFLALAGVPVPAEMTGRSLVALLESERSGRVDPARDHVLFGKERHVPAQEAPDMGGYPIRALRTHEFLYVQNFRPERWPNGTPDHEHAAIPGHWYADIENGPTKLYLVSERERDDVHRRAFELCFAKRPAEELYDLAKDPEQLRNVAADPAYAERRAELAARLNAELEASADPRIAGEGDRFDEHPYLGGGPKHPGPAYEERLK
jgi:arylsulfatase A-like enzyme